MRHIIKYLGALLSVALIGTAFTACSDTDEIGSGDLGLGIKTFFPTKVVTNQPMTINGSGFFGATEIEFPGGAVVTDFEVVSNDMIRVNAPTGIAEEGGKVVVRSVDDEAESRQTLTLGHTNVTGFSKQPGEAVTGGDQITVYGSDLEFINSVELLDPDSVWQIVDQKDFYRKGTSNLIFIVPRKNIYKGTFTGYLRTYDGQKIALPELAYEPAADEGHFEVVKTSIWKNDGSLGDINWNGIYRFAPEGNSTGEECYTVPADIWERMKAETFYVTVKGAAPQIRVTTGWWSTTWTGNDIQPGNELLEDLGDGTYRLAVTLAGDPIIDAMDAQHLLFTGANYSVEELYFETEEWVDGPGDVEVKVPVWTNDDPGGHGSISWNGTYRFGLDGTDGNNECIATFPQEVWDKLKTGTFYMRYRPDGDSYQIRVTTGWWSTQWLGADNDIAPWNMAERIIDNGDGTYYIEVNFGDDPIVDAIDAQHLLFTGSGYTPLEIYFIDIVPGGGGGPKEVPFWTGDGSAGSINWNGTYRFCLEGTDANSECIAELPQDVWDKIKSGPFYMCYRPDGDSYQIRVTTGWWSTQWLGADNDIAPWNMAERIIDNGDGTYYIEVNFGDDPIVGSLDVEHLLFTGSGYTPLKLYFLE